MQDLLERWSVIAIAASLLIIGGFGLVEAREGAGEAELTETTGTVTKKLLTGTLTTGFVHGLSPDGLLMLFPIVAMPLSRAVIYLSGILFGTIAAVAACTAAFCATTRFLAKSSGSSRMQTRISVASSLVALGIGFFMFGEVLLG